MPNPCSWCDSPAVTNIPEPACEACAVKWGEPCQHAWIGRVDDSGLDFYSCNCCGAHHSPYPLDTNAQGYPI